MHLAHNPLLTMIAHLYVNKSAKKSRSPPASRTAFYDTAISRLLDHDRELTRAEGLRVAGGTCQPGRRRAAGPA